MLPIGVPWFGALGAVTLSLYGVFDHNDHWNPKWNYWYIARPLVGIILAIIAYFTFITLINSTGLTPRTSATSMSTSTTSSTTLAPTTTGNPATSATSAPGQTGGTATGRHHHQSVTCSVPERADRGHRGRHRDGDEQRHR